MKDKIATLDQAKVISKRLNEKYAEAFRKLAEDKSVPSSEYETRIDKSTHKIK